MRRGKYKEKNDGTLNTVSKSTHGTVSHFGCAFKAASSLYAPGRPCVSGNSLVRNDINNAIKLFFYLKRTIKHHADQKKKKKLSSIIPYKQRAAYHLKKNHWHVIALQLKRLHCRQKGRRKGQCD